MSDLFVADRHGQVQSDFKKAKPPKTGPSYGAWAGRAPELLELPGGAMLQFDLSKLTLADYRSMRNHYQINASLTLVSFMIHQIDWSIECESTKISNMIEENMREVWTRMIRALSQSFWAGFSPTAIEYDNNPISGQIEIGKFKDLIPEHCKVNWKEVLGAIPPGSSGTVRPKFYEYDGIKQVGSSYPIPVENTLWWPLLMENGDYYGRQLLKPAFPSWFFSILIHLYANRYFERFGEPIPVGRAPFDDEVDLGSGDSINGRDLMVNMLTSIRNRAVAVLPADGNTTSTGKRDYDYTIEYLESQMRGADFERYLDRLDEEMSLSIFTPVLLMRTADVGSYNLGVGHLQTFMWLLNAIVGDMKEYIDRYVVKRLKDYNFGERAPKAQWVPRPMGKENIETIRGIVVELIRADKVMPDLDALGQELGIDLKKVRQIQQPIPVPGQPGAAAVPGQDPRQGRPERPTGQGPRGVGQPRATGRKVAARIESQISNTFKQNAWPTFRPDLGYKKEMRDSFIFEGASTQWADEATVWLYSNLREWFMDVRDLEWESPSPVIVRFNRLLDGLIGELGNP